MEGFSYQPPEYKNPEAPFGEDTIEVTSTGDIETTADSEGKDKYIALLKLVQRLRAYKLLHALLALLIKRK